MSGMVPRADQSNSAKPNAMRQLGPWRLLQCLGHGGMSEVYLAYDSRDESHVALKILSDHLSRSKQFVNRFYREARLGKYLQHEHLIPVHQAGFDAQSNRHYIAMQYIEGCNASQLLQRLGRLPWRHAFRIIEDIAQALAYLHERDYIHRDVKPENILLGLNGAVKLADLGLAKKMSSGIGLTTTHQNIGTPNYMSYEQAANSSLADHRSDLYSLGASLYHMITGILPFPEDRPVDQRDSDSCQPITEIVREVPKAVDGFILQMLSIDPRQRIQSAQKLTQLVQEKRWAIPRKDWRHICQSIISTDQSRPANSGIATQQNRTRLDLASPAGAGGKAPQARSEVLKSILVPAGTISQRTFWLGILLITLVAILTTMIVLIVRSDHGEAEKNNPEVNAGRPFERVHHHRLRRKDSTWSYRIPEEQE